MNMQVTFRGIPSSPALGSIARRKARKLQARARGMRACEVVVEAPPRHHHKGGPFRVRVQLHGRGSCARQAAHPNAHVALREAFRAAERYLASESGRSHAATA